MRANDARQGHSIDPSIRRVVSGYFREQFSGHGATAQGVGWKDRASQRLRLDVILDLIGIGQAESVADLGCGYGEALRMLRERGHSGRYTGIDIEPTLVEAARREFAPDAAASFVVADAVHDEHDWVIESGIFNMRPGIDDAVWEPHVRAVVGSMYRAARKGIAFNCLSLHSDAEKRRADLHYADPGALLDWCGTTLSRHTALRADYGLWEFTIAVLREPRPPESLGAASRPARSA